MPHCSLPFKKFLLKLDAPSSPATPLMLFCLFVALHLRAHRQMKMLERSAGKVELNTRQQATGKYQIALQARWKEKVVLISMRLLWGCSGDVLVACATYLCWKNFQATTLGRQSLGRWLNLKPKRETKSFSELLRLSR